VVEHFKSKFARESTPFLPLGPIQGIESFRPMDDSSEPLNEFLNRRQDHERAILAAIEFLKQLIAENDSPIAEPWCNRALEHCRALRDDECFKYLGMALTYVAARKAGV
jgi:hypothetical protein